MLYLLLYPLHVDFPVLNVFRYITFRAAYAALTAMLISFILGPWMIRTLRRLQVGQSIREEGPQSHQGKAGTPTMGGVLILDAVLVPTLLWADITNFYIWVICGVTLAFGAIGFADDYIKVVKKRNLGLTAKAKFGSQLLASGAVAALIGYVPGHKYSTVLTFPFLKAFSVDLGFLYLPFVMLVIVGASNAVNLTDGLDGLAIGSTLIAAGTYAILTYIVGHATVAAYLRVPHISGAGELAVFCGALAGASLGFLWFNCFPAQIFMGDVGALALGAAIGTLAVITKMEVLLVLVGGLFVIEALSVILQVASFKLTGKRIFRMSPLHHHFELAGWKEPQVIIRFWIVAIIFSLLALSTLKLR